MIPGNPRSLCIWGYNTSCHWNAPWIWTFFIIFYLAERFCRKPFTGENELASSSGSILFYLLCFFFFPFLFLLISVRDLVMSASCALEEAVKAHAALQLATASVTGLSPPRKTQNGLLPCRLKCVTDSIRNTNQHLDSPIRLFLLFYCFFYILQCLALCRFSLCYVLVKYSVVVKFNFGAFNYQLDFVN